MFKPFPIEILILLTSKIASQLWRKTISCWGFARRSEQLQPEKHSLTTFFSHNIELHTLPIYTFCLTIYNYIHHQYMYHNIHPQPSHLWYYRRAFRNFLVWCPESRTAPAIFPLTSGRLSWRNELSHLPDFTKIWFQKTKSILNHTHPQLSHL